MMHPITKVLAERKKSPSGIPSYCTANRQVLTAIIRDAAKNNRMVLIESTANQVDQYGGYTGMKPKDFVQFVAGIAAETGCGMDRIILGGDHLGPLTFTKYPEAEAMARAEELVRRYVLAGFTKIHLDTSMKVADDPSGPLDKTVCARRGAQLCKAAEAAFHEYQKDHSAALHPVYVIGSEVPIPGGATEQENHISVTDPDDCADTIDIYQKYFEKNGLSEAWQYVVAVVVQPGVEFGDNSVFQYKHESAANLMKVLKKYPSLVFEGHSTDYQPGTCLSQMVEDGIAILKVGPLLTFALRNALFALSEIEKELVPEERRANLPAVLERQMVLHPENWQSHYHGTDEEKRLARSYSLSDRARYYIGRTEVTQAMNKLFQNLNAAHIPMGLLFQYLPKTAEAVLAGICGTTASDLVEHEIMNAVEPYIKACNIK